MAVVYPIVDRKGRLEIMQSGRRSGSIAQTANFRKFSNFDKKKQMESDLFAVSSEQGGHQNFLKFATVTWNMNSGGAARKAEGWLCP